MLQRQFGIILLLVLLQMNSKASVQLLIVRVQLPSPHTSPPVFDLWKEGPSGKGLAFISVVVWF